MNTFTLNLGNQRHNITQIICKLPGGRRNFEALDFLLDEALRGERLIRTLVYCNSRETAMQAALYLIDKAPDEYQDKISFTHGFREERAKTRPLRLFREGTVDILFATEVRRNGRFILLIPLIVY